jgi:hypothetical protein
MNLLKKYFIRILVLTTAHVFGTEAQSQMDNFILKKELSKELKEISGIVKDGNFLWAISDSKNAPVFKLDLSGNIVQQIHLSNITLEDVEAVTSDDKYLYVGDIGDNEGTRSERKIIRILKSSLGNGTSVKAKGELINFTFPGEGTVKKKKSNDYDCEALISYNDSLYVFTKRREDMKTGLYSLPKIPGTYEAKSIAVFKTKGLVTDAALNAKGNEIALVGYDEGHTRPFIWIFGNFSGNNFFSGSHKRYELTNEKKLDWQIEGITYKDATDLFISCEKSKDVDNTLYVISKAELRKSKKGKPR